MPRSSSRRGKPIESVVVFTGVTPHDVYETLLDARRQATFTGGEALISRRVGGMFTTFDGWASGRQIELVPDRKIVQTWRSEDWPSGTTSTCTYELRSVPTGTELRFRQTDVPSSLRASIAKGWAEYYWRPMQALFDSGADERKG